MDQGSERKESPHECAGKYHCEGCFIAEVDNRRVRMITTTRYARSAWVGNLIVVPERRRQGIGETLMAHAIDLLKRCGIPMTERPRLRCSEVDDARRASSMSPRPASEH